MISFVLLINSNLNKKAGKTFDMYMNNRRETPMLVDYPNTPPTACLPDRVL